MEEYRRVWAIAPNYVQTHHQAGLVYLKKGQDDRRRFEELRGQGKMAEANAMFQQTVSDWNQALLYFDKYHAIDPVFGPNYSRLGWVHMQLAELAQLQGHAPRRRPLRRPRPRTLGLQASRDSRAAQYPPPPAARLQSHDRARGVRAIALRWQRSDSGR